MKSYRDRAVSVSATEAAIPVPEIFPEQHEQASKVQMKKKVYRPTAMSTLMPDATFAPVLPSVVEEFESYIAETSALDISPLEFWAVS